MLRYGALITRCKVELSCRIGAVPHRAPRSSAIFPAVANKRRMRVVVHASLLAAALLPQHSMSFMRPIILASRTIGLQAHTSAACRASYQSGVRPADLVLLQCCY
jgi:hypothetical protein